MDPFKFGQVVSGKDFCPRPQETDPADDITLKNCYFSTGFATILTAMASV